MNKTNKPALKPAKLKLSSVTSRPSLSGIFMPTTASHKHFNSCVTYYCIHTLGFFNFFNKYKVIFS